MASVHPEVEFVARSNFAFSNALLDQLRHNEGDGNFVFSPFSLGLILLAAKFGARGSTASQLDRVLSPAGATVTLDEQRLMRRGLFRILKSIEADQSNDYSVTVANRMFTGLGFNVQEEFKKLSRATLDIKVKQLDFTEDGGRPAAEAINSWVANKTNGKINGSIFPRSLQRQNQVVLVNAIHFKAPWHTPFELDATSTATFHLNSNEQTQVAMMMSENDYSFGDFQELDAQAVVIPYKGNRFSMHIYVPKTLNGLDGLLHALKNTSLDQLRRSIREPGLCEIVRLSLPKFKIQSELKLTEPLKKMGIVDMFLANRADFTTISGDGHLYVSHVLQKTYIEVDEAGSDVGTAASSAAPAEMTCSSTIRTVVADRPFSFQIVDEQTGIVLFAGAVRDPNADAKPVVHPEAQLVTKNNFAFSNALHEQLKINGEGGNLVYSPFSLGLVLLAARMGSRGDTAVELDRVLNPIDSGATNELENLRSMRRGFFRVLKNIRHPESRNSLTLENRIFTGTGFDLQDEFKRISRATLNIKVKPLNFTEDGGRKAADTINSWVANKTEGKIGEITSPDALQSQGQIVLVSTIHFRAPWNKPFDPADAVNSTFFLNSNETVQVALMKSQDRYPHGDLGELNATAVVIPYQGKRHSLHVYIPKRKDGLDDFLHALKNVSMQQIRRHIRKSGNCEKVELSLPKFKIQSELKLVEPLRQMGARDMFSLFRANFSGIIVSDDEEVFVSHVLQKAFITVDEKGTEVSATPDPRNESEPICAPIITHVKADRPFYFQILDEEMGVLLLAGAVRDPSSAEPLPDLQPKLYFGTSQSGIKAYSDGAADAETIFDSTENLSGVAWDPVNQRLYFCSPKVIYRARYDGRYVQTVFRAAKYYAILALAFDWITSNLYGVTSTGHIFACNTKEEGSLNCVTILSKQGRLHGIAVDPNQGTMYWTTYYDSRRRGSITRAGLDGSNRTEIVEGLQSPGGIVIDHSSSMLFWTDHFANCIQSSDLDGGNIRTVATLQGRTTPWGIALYGDKLFWGNYHTMTLQSANKSGGSDQTVYRTDTNPTHLVLVTKAVPKISRRNDCDGQSCGKICVLTPTSFRCVD